MIDWFPDAGADRGRVKERMEEAEGGGDSALFVRPCPFER